MGQNTFSYAIGGWCRMPALSGFCAKRLALLVLCLAPSICHADPTDKRYLLGPLDLIRVKAFEWQAARDDVFEWKALNDQFYVGPEGTISLPFVGEVKAAGLDTAELGQRIARQMKENMGFGKAPSVSVEVIKFRPFYIAGDVRTPGEYPYRPSLTVLQALSVAGGLYRENGDNRYFAREMIQTKGEISIIDIQLMQLSAQKARLESEMRDDREIKFPDVLTRRKSEPSVAHVLLQEDMLFRTRRRSFDTELKALEELRSFLTDSIETLKALFRTQETQLNLARKEFAGIGSLADKGLATSSRSFGIQRDVAQLEGDKLKVLNSQNQAQEELSKADLAIIALRNTRVKDITVELRQTQIKLDEFAQRSKMNEQLLIEAAVGVTQLRAEGRDAEMQPTYSIVRSSSGHTEELPASEVTSVEPGDTIKVTLPLPPVRDAGEYGAMSETMTSPSSGLAKAPEATTKASQQ